MKNMKTVIPEISFFCVFVYEVLPNVKFSILFTTFVLSDLGL